MNIVHEQCPKSDSVTVLSQKLAKCTMCTATAQPARTSRAKAARAWSCRGQPSTVSQRRAPATPCRETACSLAQRPRAPACAPSAPACAPSAPAPSAPYALACRAPCTCKSVRACASVLAYASARARAARPTPSLSSFSLS